MKKIVFIAGADFSGTTVLDLCLSSTKEGFSLGEVHAYFWKTLPRHESINCWCNNPDCSVWNYFDPNDDSDLYPSLFQNNPKTQYLVDSSKNLRWIRKKSKDCKRDKLPTKTILIWKTADDFLLSCKKRGRERFARFRWLAYNLSCLYKFPHAYTISFSDLVNKPEETLQKLCSYLEIDYDPSIMEYGQKQHHTMHGNKGPRTQVRLVKQKKLKANSDIKLSKSGIFRYVEKTIIEPQSRPTIVIRFLGFSLYLTEYYRSILKVISYKTMKIFRGQSNASNRKR